jgi:hypothetical protein
MLCNQSQHPPRNVQHPPAVHRAAAAGYDQYTLVYSACNLHPLTNRSMLDVYRDLIASTSREHAPCTRTSLSLPRQSSRARPRAARPYTPRRLLNARAYPTHACVLTLWAFVRNDMRGFRTC